jgi:hypothetical protein
LLSNSMGWRVNAGVGMESKRLPVRLIDSPDRPTDDCKYLKTSGGQDRPQVWYLYSMRMP